LRLALRSCFPLKGQQLQPGKAGSALLLGNFVSLFFTFFSFLEPLMPQQILKLLSFVFAWLACAPALAHEGHGLAGSHWHVADAWGFAALGLGLAAAVWFSKEDK
jgi:hypothetical protein